MSTQRPHIDPAIYHRFTDRATQAMDAAFARASADGSEKVGTRHLLLALADGQITGVAANVLRNLGFEPDAIQSAVSTLDNPVQNAVESLHLVVESAFKYARDLRVNYVGTEHLLLALASDADTVAGMVLNSLQITPDDIRAEVANLLGCRGI